MTTISATNSNILYAYGTDEQNKKITRTVSNGINSSTDTVSEQTRTISVNDGSQTDTVSISTFVNDTKHVSIGYWLPSKNGDLGGFCSAGTLVNGVNVKDVPGAEPGTFSFDMVTGRAVCGTYSETGAGTSSSVSFSLLNDKGNVSGTFTSIQTQEIASLFGINENKDQPEKNYINNKILFDV